MRIDLAKFMQEEFVYGKDGYIALSSCMGDDTHVQAALKAMDPRRAHNIGNTMHAVRYVVRQRRYEALTVCYCTWKLQIPLHVKRHFPLGIGTWIGREDVIGDMGEPYAIGYWTTNLAEVFDVLKWWLDIRGPRETRPMARHIQKVVRSWVPLTWNAFDDYDLHGVRLSRAEIQMVRAATQDIAYKGRDPSDVDLRQWWGEYFARYKMFNEIEQSEFIEKMKVQTDDLIRARRRQK